MAAPANDTRNAGVESQIFRAQNVCVFSSFSSLSLNFPLESAGEIGPDKNKRYTCILLVLIEAVLDAHSCRL